MFEQNISLWNISKESKNQLNQLKDFSSTNQKFTIIVGYLETTYNKIKEEKDLFLNCRNYNNEVEFISSGDTLIKLFIVDLVGTYIKSLDSVRYDEDYESLFDSIKSYYEPYGKFKLISLDYPDTKIEFIQTSFTFNSEDDKKLFGF